VLKVLRAYVSRSGDLLSAIDRHNKPYTLLIPVPQLHNSDKKRVQRLTAFCTALEARLYGVYRDEAHKPIPRTNLHTASARNVVNGHASPAREVQAGFNIS
jgi:hypothetical protein